MRARVSAAAPDPPEAIARYAPRRWKPAGGRPHQGTALGARSRRLRGHVGHGRAVLAVGRNILEIAYRVACEQTTYRELGIDYDRYRAEELKCRSLAQLQHLGYHVTLTPFSAAA
jgi:hypothetical protein